MDTGSGPVSARRDGVSEQLLQQLAGVMDINYKGADNSSRIRNGDSRIVVCRCKEDSIFRRWLSTRLNVIICIKSGVRPFMYNSVASQRRRNIVTAFSSTRYILYRI